MHHTTVPYDDAGSTTKLTGPSIDQNGNVYVGWVAGAEKPIVKISPDFATQTTVAATGVNYNRSALVSPDASHLF